MATKPYIALSPSQPNAGSPANMCNLGITFTAKFVAISLHSQEWKSKVLLIKVEWIVFLFGIDSKDMVFCKMWRLDYL